MSRENIKRNEFFIGLAMLIATLIVVFGILWLGKSNMFVKGLQLRTFVKDANGLGVGDEVFYSGIKVGTVTDVEITDGGVIIYSKIDKITEIPDDSKFIISDYSMIGGKVLSIIPGNSKKYLKQGALVNGSVNPGLNGSIGKLTSIVPKINRILDNLNEITGGKNVAEINSAIKEIRNAAKGMNNLINGELKSTIDNINSIADNNKSNITELLKNLNKNSNELSKMLKKTSDASQRLSKLLKSIEEGNGTLGKLSENDSLYNNLNRAVISLDSLLNDIKQHPKKYLEIKVL